MTLTSEVKSDGYGGWTFVPRIHQIWALISKSGRKAFDCRIEWAKFYQIDTSYLNDKNKVKVHDIRRFLEKSEYAYRKREERLLEELNEKQILEE